VPTSLENALGRLHGSLPHPGGAACSPRLEGWGQGPGLMVRDGAHVPPHHDGLV